MRRFRYSMLPAWPAAIHCSKRARSVRSSSLPGAGTAATPARSKPASSANCPTRDGHASCLMPPHANG
ncbi:conserved domain protein [Acidobacterium capsulatum ATCC 51196]|uniref:Conserved domain protein n=1 Tax=Acidobacterium capsulatum (strain ATCC 51196 / DSM 11244 / BCRC 80197 / JCM 7670 / NBRC 15755 / NCIMB 13165 / 161) TaxID=240015 RepID=C1F529_ACIC5|nr:conserved domain protein [Acidobacterium capsulatum ATCC 51196]